jgi:hypothetical protein
VFFEPRARIAAQHGFRDVPVFVAAYLLLSVPPFFVRRRARLSALRAELARNVVVLAFLGTIVLLMLTLASLARTGGIHYVEFLHGPTDPPGIVNQYIDWG